MFQSMSVSARRVCRATLPSIILAASTLLAPTEARAQVPDSAAKAPAAKPKPPAKQAKAPPKPAPAPAEEARPDGLPKKFKWKFNFDAGAGVFGFGNSLYTDVRPDPSGDLSDNWFESFVKPALSTSIGFNKGELYAKASAVGERTFAAPPPLVGTEASSFQVEDLYLGWRSGTSIGKTENALDVTVGRTPYTIGHGFILWDGGGEGGSRGGFWSNARKAWKMAGVARLHFGNHSIQGFYLDRDDVPENKTHTETVGGNYEYAFNDANTIGATFLHFWADGARLPGRDGMNVYNARAFLAPFKKLPQITLEGEFAHEENGDIVSSNGWTVGGGYQFLKTKWKPRVSYRYASFQGDDPGTAKSEAFDPLIPGFYDWGTWWQGEIGGEYFLSNSNLISHQVRVHLTPSEKVGTGLIGYVFQLDQQGGFTSKSIATEIDAYCDWKMNSNFTTSFVAAWANPGTVAREGFNRTSDFVYGMIYVAYSY